MFIQRHISRLSPRTIDNIAPDNIYGSYPQVAATFLSLVRAAAITSGTGTYIADTPGFSNFDIYEIPYRELYKYFKEFNETKCRYRIAFGSA